MRRLWRALRLLLAVFLTGGMLYACTALPHGRPVFTLPGGGTAQRTLLRIWVTSAPGGGMAWLRSRLAAFEKAFPGTMTYVRQVTTDMCRSAEAPPDMILFMPGNFTAPEDVMLPITGTANVSGPLLRSGRRHGLQYGLPLCWGGWVLAIDSAYDDIPAATPAPSTLIGIPAATPPPGETPTPGLPVERLRHAATPLLAPPGGGLFTLGALLGSNHSLLGNGSAALKTSADVYAAFRNRQAAAALLTTGQLTAFEGLQRAGRGFPVRALVPDAVVTDQVWYAGLCNADGDARTLLAFLISDASQTALRDQGLYSVCLDRALYATGVPAQIECAARRSMTAVNAFIPKEVIAQLAWQALDDPASAKDALTQLAPHE